MKFSIPEISWHNRDPVLSADFQPKSEPNDPLRLATGGTDSHVLIWYVSTSDTGSVNLEVAADLTRHQKAVNVVRWSPNGQLLASGDDESIIFVWKQKTDKDTAQGGQNLEQGEEQYKESWAIYKTLRGHVEDVLDLSWSADSLHIASGSVDNKLLVWEVARGRYSTILTDHKGFVQGVTWDPKGEFIATASSDRVFRAFDVTSKKVVSRSSKAILPFPSGHSLHDVKVRLYHDDTLQTFYRRLQFSPDGLLIAVPSGRIEPEQGKLDIKPINAVYIYTRYSLKAPAVVVPCGEPALVVRWSARRYRPRAAGGARPARGGLAVPRHMLLAVATRRSVLLYDTQQKTPVAVISNMHYTRLTDLTWSPDGLTLVASSTDGFCSLITFAPGELGEVVPDDELIEESKAEELKKVKPEEPKVEEKTEKPTETKTDPKTDKSNTPKIDSFIKFKAPTDKSPKKRKIDQVKQKTPIKRDILEESAMLSWSDNSNNEIIKPKETAMDVDTPETLIIEDSEDMKLVYEETEGNKSLEETTNTVEKSSEVVKTSPKEKDTNFFKQAKVTDVKEQIAVNTVASPKAPRRVNFVTLSSPKNSKKK